MQIVDVQIRAMQPADLSMVREWRNHPDVRRYMFQTHEITALEHQSWFEKIQADQSKLALIVEDLCGPFGYVHFNNVCSGGVADWGFYTRPDAPKGCGMRLGRTALSYAYDFLELHKVCGQVIEGNAASLAFHQKMGFRKEGVLREHKIIDESHHTIICFGLLKTEWQASVQNEKAASDRD